MQSIFMSVVMSLIGNVMPKAIGKPNENIDQVRMSVLYLKSIKTLRLLFISLLVIGLCLTLVTAGLILFHVSLFLYAPWSDQTKMTVGLLCAVIYLGVGTIVFTRLFLQEKWIKMFHAQGIVDELNGKKRDE